MPSAKVLQVTFSSKPVMDSQDLSSDKECDSKIFKTSEELKNWREGIGRNVKMQMTVNMNENELYEMTTRRTVTNCLLRSEMVAL